jgi:amino acid transporter/nucleotide-binding universal stress UspA family protein
MKTFNTEVRLAREMSLMDATLIGVGAMIGAGIFVLIGIAAGVAGPGLLLTFLLNAVIALLTAMSYAELGSCYHDAGGGYLWVKEGLPKWNGFLSGWMSWFAHAVACSLYALGFGAYFQHLLFEFSINMPDWGFFSPQKILAAGTAILFAYVNFRGASETGKIGNLVTITKIIILLIFIGFGLELIVRNGDWRTTFSPFLPNGFTGVFKSMGLTFIAFQGFEVIAQSSEEIRNPRKNIPLAVFLSLLIVVPIYILVAITALGTVRPDNGMKPWDFLAQQKEIALVNVAKNFFVGGGIMLLIGGLISTISALNATIYSSSRVAFAMGRDRNFPSFFSKVHPKNFTPQWAIMVSLIIIIVMAVSLPIEDVASAADIMFLLLFLQVNIAMIRLRKKRKDLDRGFKVPLFPYISIAGILSLLFLAVYMFKYSISAWIVTIIWSGLGLLVYYFYARKREVEHIRKERTLAQIVKKEYKLLVYLSDESNINSISSIAMAIAKKHNAKIIFLYVIELLQGEKLKKGIKLTDIAEEMVQKAQNLADDSGISSSSIIKISHRISKGIYDTYIEEDCNFVLMDRRKVTNFLERFFFSVIDSVLQKSTTEVAILHGEIKQGKIKKILIPYSQDIHSQLAAEITPALIDYFKAEVTFAVVFSPGTTNDEQKIKTDQINKLLKENNISAGIVTIQHSDILQGIIILSSESDLVVMGGKTGDFIELLFSKSLVREITEQVKCPVLWFKEYEERQSFLLSLFKNQKNKEA